MIGKHQKEQLLHTTDLIIWLYTIIKQLLELSHHFED